MAISVKNLNFFYGSSQALFDINLDAQEGDTVVFKHKKKSPSLVKVVQEKVR